VLAPDCHVKTSRCGGSTTRYRPLTSSTAVGGELDEPERAAHHGVGLRLGQRARAGVGYAALILPFIVAGIGISFVFPTLANAAVGSVPLADSGVAAGANNTLREAGGLFGVAVLAAVFTANGGYVSPAAFMHGMRSALLVAGAVALAAVIPALSGPSRAAALANAANTAGTGGAGAAETAPTTPPARQARGSSRSS
jgi:hypothetical protein